MGTIRLIQKPQNGQIIFNVPDEMREQTIIIEFRPVHEQPQTTTIAEASKVFFEKLNHIKTDFNEEDFNVYKQ